MEAQVSGIKSTERNAPHLLSLLCGCGTSRLTLLLGLGFALFLVAISPVQTVFAASLAGNVLQNADFESGSLSPGWVKWGYPRSTVTVLPCCNHTLGGSFSAYIVPDGKYVELQQNFDVGPDKPILRGHNYHVQGYVYTNGLVAHVGWWINDGGPAHDCGTTSSSTYVLISCDFTVPDSTTVTMLNVHLGANSPQGSGQFAITDDWSLTYNGNDFVNGNLRSDSQDALNTSRDYIVSIKAGDKPAAGGGYTTGWLGVNLAPCTGQLYSCRFTQVGFITTNTGPRWFVYTETGTDRPVTCDQGTHDMFGNFGCNGTDNERATIGQWQKVELVTYGQGFWIARVYDQYGNALDMVHIWSTSTAIYGAYATTEEAYSTVGDPFLTASFSYSHPQYMRWGTGFQEWLPTAGSNRNTINTWPWLICPPYGATQSIGGDNRVWFGGTNGSQCSVDPLF